MSLRSVVLALSLLPALSLGQLIPNTITVTASSSPSAQPDQAVFSISVAADISKSLDDIVKALAGSGITAANLIGVSATLPTPPVPPPPMIWTFQLIVPLSNSQTETASLTSLQKSLAQNNGGPSLISFVLQNAQISAQQFQNCDLAGLIADARTQAQTIASAAGMSPTSIIGLQGTASQSALGCSLAATFALGLSSQPGPHTITIVATRTLNPLPDQVLIGITVDSSLTAGLNDVSRAITAAGISAANFSGVSTFTVYSPLANGQSYLQWSFTLATPLATLKDTLVQLGMAQQTISKQNPTLSASIQVQSLQVSPQAQPICPQTGLVSDATAQAQKVAAAAGLSTGAVLSMSSVPASIPSSASAIYDPLGVSVTGNLSSISGYASFLLGPVASNTSLACSLAVQFQLN